MAQQAILNPVKRDQFDFVDKESGEAVRIARYIVFVTLPGSDFPVQVNIKDEGQFEVGKTYTAEYMHLANKRFGIDTVLSNIKLSSPAAFKP